MQLPNIQDVLLYKNPRVLKLYEQNYPNNKLTAEEAFEETLKYLWLTQKHVLDCKNSANDDLPSECIMLRSMREIDEMWHEFILFTEDYTKFCKQYFGEYIHHLPNIFDNSPVARDIFDVDVAKMLSYVYDHLGEGTLRVWFGEYLEDSQ